MVILGWLACAGPDTQERAQAQQPVVLRVDYGSEKQAWLEDAIDRFEASGPRLASGRRIDVQSRSLGSGEAVSDILAGRSQPHVFSPASSAYLVLLDDGWLQVAGHTAPLVGKAEPIVLSPVVIAMWRPMAEALGWPERPVRWSDLLAIATSPDGWASRGHPEWGRFKLAHTHPGLSNSGLLAVLSEVYAASGKTRGLTPGDLPAAEPFVASVEASLVHYGKSTGFVADKMLERGPDYVSAVVSYENLVVSSYQTQRPAQQQVVAVYPAEGTFWSDHPWALLEASWVGPEEREAAAALEGFLRSQEIQTSSLHFGFRPADPSLPLAAPLDAAHGVDPRQPQTLLEVPDAATLREVLALWERTKKTSDVVLVFDKSGSMKGAPLVEAKRGANAFLSELGDRDTVSLLFFDSVVHAPGAPQLLGPGRAALSATLDGTLASGGTALYDAVRRAHEEAMLRAAAEPGRIHAVVVLTDGRDENSRTTLEVLQRQLAGDAEAPVKIFTIAYGQADPAVLAAIAEAGKGATAKGDPADIASVFLDMAAFF
jgi:Ca-activated chloride channel family protein